MSLPDNAAINALYQPVIKPVFFVFLDISGSQVRCNTSGADVTPTGTGDPDLDGYTFLGISGQFVDIGTVRYASGGSESLNATLSGIPEVDAETIAQMDNPTNWRGRDARLWRVIRNAQNLQQGGFHAYYTGKMTNFSHAGDPDAGHVMQVTIESYLAVFSQASNRTYMDQERFDPDDLSAKAAIAIANGNFTGAVVPSQMGDWNDNARYSNGEYW